MSGLRLMNKQVSWIVISAMFLSLTSAADDAGLNDTLDLEILEFLGGGKVPKANGWIP